MGIDDFPANVSRIDMSLANVSAWIHQISTPSLGDHSYLINVSGEVAAIDIQRDLDRFEATIARMGGELTAVFETHIHNDYVSGGGRLAGRHGARYVLPADTGASFDHMALGDGQRIGIGPWAIRAMRTPGHTFNHTSYVLESDQGPIAVFSGGSMLVASVGRSDLLGPEHTDELMEAQFGSVRRIASELSGTSIVAPTHGAGSFCSASAVADTMSTIERERLQNPALVTDDVEQFKTTQRLGYRIYPAYYHYMAPANLNPLGAPPQDLLPVIGTGEGVDGRTVIDVRSFDDYAKGHLRGSISVPASDDDAVYIAWLIEWNSPIVMVGSEATVDSVRSRLQRVGWDAVVGRIDPASLSDVSDGPLATTGRARFADIDSQQDGTLVDVRDPVEHADGVIGGAVPVHFADFAREPATFANSPVTIHCQSGYRAAVVAGFAERAGLDVTIVSDDLSNYPGQLVSP